MRYDVNHEVNVGTVLRSTIVALVVVILSAVHSTSLQSQRKFGPGVCGPADPVYLETATETGGQPFFLSPDEMSSSARIMGASSQNELILWASANGEKTYMIPVDPSVERVTFSATFDGTGGMLTIRSPQGVEVQQDARTEDTRLNCGRVVTIDAPAHGMWVLRASPSAKFWLVARAKSELSLIATEFVQPGGRPGHEGLFKIQGYPIVGQPAMLRVRLSSPVTRPRFELVTIDAYHFHRFDLRSQGDEEFVGAVTLPEQPIPFRIMATGFDESGVPVVQRMAAPVFHASYIEVIPPARDTVVAGTTTPVTFTVRNGGPGVQLTLTATDGRGNVLAVKPAMLQLNSGMQESATVRLMVPADALPESETSVLLTASGADASAPMNYAQKRFTVVAAK